MTLMGSNTSQTLRTDTSSLTNTNNAPTSSPLYLNNICPVTMSTNNHAMTPNLPPHDIRQVLSNNHSRTTQSNNASLTSGNPLPLVYKAMMDIVTSDLINTYDIRSQMLTHDGPKRIPWLIGEPMVALLVTTYVYWTILLKWQMLLVLKITRFKALLLGL